MLQGRVCNPVIIHLATSALWHVIHFALFGIPQRPSASVSKINRAIVQVKRLFFTGFTAIKVDMISHLAPKSSTAHVFIFANFAKISKFFYMLIIPPRWSLSCLTPTITNVFL